MLVQRAEVTATPTERVVELADDALNRPRTIPTPEHMIASPVIHFGSVTSIADDLRRLRSQLGISYFAVFGGDRSHRSDGVVAAPAGT